MPMYRFLLLSPAGGVDRESDGGIGDDALMAGSKLGEGMGTVGGSGA